MPRWNVKKPSGKQFVRNIRRLGGRISKGARVVDKAMENSSVSRFMDKNPLLVDAAAIAAGPAGMEALAVYTTVRNVQIQSHIARGGAGAVKRQQQQPQHQPTPPVLHSLSTDPSQQRQGHYI